MLPWLAAACGGALYFLAFVGFGVWPLAFVFLVPFWWSLERLRSPARAALAGLVFGLVAHSGGHLWLWRLVDVFLAGDVVLGGALWGLHALWFAVGFSGYALLFVLLRGRGRSLAVAGIAPLLVVEWLQVQIFPVHAGATLAGVVPLVQIADVGGPLGLSAFVAAIDVVVYFTLAWAAGAFTLAWAAGAFTLARAAGAFTLARAAGAFTLAPAAGAFTLARTVGTASLPVRAWVFAAVLVAGVWGYGAARVRAIDVEIAEAERARPLRVGIVQANLDVHDVQERTRATHDAHVALSRELLEGGPLDLLVWPETAELRAIRGPLPVSGRFIQEDLAVPLLFGGTLVGEADGRRARSNAAFLVEPDGMIRSAYRKNLLIPLAESIPFGNLFPGLAERLPHAQEFVAASDPSALELGAVRIATPICYEAVRPGFVRAMVEASHPHLIVTLANDAWFGDSQEPWMHLQLARMRAVEHRRYLVRATHSGISAVIDPAGRIRARTPLLERATLRATVVALDGRTLYGRFGDWPGVLAAGVLAWAWLGPRQPRWPA